MPPIASTALQGLRVLDLSTLLAAPLIAAALGDFGADVVKVESPAGDPLRPSGPGSTSPLFELASRNKRMVVLEHASAAGQQLLQELLAVADVVVLNQTQALLQRWGCTPEQILERNARAVVVNVSAYGRTGPLADAVGNGSIAEAFGGMTHMVGNGDGPPMLTSLFVGDYLAALHGVIGVLAACYWRDAAGGGTGCGQCVDVAMFEPVTALLATSTAGWREGDPAPRRSASRSPRALLRNVYGTRDGEWIAVSASTRAQVGRLLEYMGRPGDAATLPADALDALVGGWVAAQDAAAVLCALESVRVPATLVRDLPSVRAHPQVRARGSLLTLCHPQLGELVLPAPSPALGASPGSVRLAGALGFDTEAVRREWLARPSTRQSLQTGVEQ